MNLLSSILRWKFKQPVHRISYFIQHPHEMQKDTLLSLLSIAQNTEWGEKYNYQHIKSYSDYKKAVPITKYERIFPYIDRMMKGEQNILWPTEIKWFAKSSGTTNAKSKFIPVSKESLENMHFQGGKDLISLYLKNQPDSNFFMGKGLSIGGTFEENPYFKGSYYGDVSAVVVKNLPFWAQLFRTPNLDIAMIDDWEEKMDKMIQETLTQNVRSILGVPTWTIVLIKRILEITGKQNLKEVWPNLELFVHGAVAFEPYRSLFDQLVPDIHYLEVYNASEGFFAIQDDLSRDDMLLMLDYGIFYEFIPLSDVDKENPDTLSIDEVELDKVYALLISTNSGLWRYNIGDTIKFTSKNPYRIKITGRTKHFINAFGEELVIDNAESAITEACKATEAIITNFTACPIYLQESRKGGHEWLIEFEKEPNNLALFAQVLDDQLKRLNSDYEAKRSYDLALLSPKIKSIPKGTFQKWLKSKGKLGGQFKVPRLSNSREHVEEILGLLDS